MVRTTRFSTRPCPRSIVVSGGGKILAAVSREGLFQGGLIRFDHHIMGPFRLHQIRDRVALRMQGIHGDNLSGDLQGI